MSQAESIVHQDRHADTEYDHVTLVTDTFIATFHRNRDELATVLHDNITPRDDTAVADLIDRVLDAAVDTVAPTVKYNIPIQHAVRWGCVECGAVYDPKTDDITTPATCPDCDVLLTREGSPKWLHSDEFPDTRVYSDE